MIRLGLSEVEDDKKLFTVENQCYCIKHVYRNFRYSSDNFIQCPLRKSLIERRIKILKINKMIFYIYIFYIRQKKLTV